MTLNQSLPSPFLIKTTLDHSLPSWVLIWTRLAKSGQIHIRNDQFRIAKLTVHCRLVNISVCLKDHMSLRLLFGCEFQLILAQKWVSKERDRQLWDPETQLFLWWEVNWEMAWEIPSLEFGWFWHRGILIGPLPMCQSARVVSLGPRQNGNQEMFDKFPNPKCGLRARCKKM